MDLSTIGQKVAARQEATDIHGIAVITAADLPNEELRNEKAERRFWKRVTKTEGCWLWEGTIRGGYGSLQVSRIRTMAHRYSWSLKFGEIPKGAQILHKCDNPLCVNPDHLFPGTQGENIADMIEKDRQAKGERNASSKLKETDVIEIRDKYASGVWSLSGLAADYGVSIHTVYMAVKHRTWRHVR